MNEEVVEKLLTASKTLVAVREMEDRIIYDKKLWKIWNEESNELVSDPVRAEEDESGHYVVRVYKNSHGYWLVKTWVAHFGYHWDEGRVYYLGPRLPI
jgi:hypothetical protein